MNSSRRPKQVDIEHFPETTLTIFGRENDLIILDEAWHNEDIRIVSFVAQGGVGKTALVRLWLEDMAKEAYRGAARVYAWSFYSQGIGNRLISAETFITHALRKWFGDTETAESSLSSWEKGRKLAEYIQKERTLLILDGLEPLQSPLPGDRGTVRDLAMASLLRQLIKKNSGLCVITTRESVRDLAETSPHTQQKNLEQISAETGRSILRAARVTGEDSELESLIQAFCNHALTITLLGAYLARTKGRHVKNANAVTAFHTVDDIDEVERYARQVIAALTDQFGEDQYNNMLYLLGLFDRPATSEDIHLLIKNKIDGLTDAIFYSSTSEWNNVLDHLRHVHLLLPESRCNKGGIDAHPIVRAHFRSELRKKPKVWCKANSLLYEYYSSLPKEHRPSNLCEMEPLYRAIDYGCQAGRHQEALDNVLIDRLRRGEEHYSFFRGFLGQEITALSRFFRHPWTEVEDNLAPLSKAWLLNEAGSVLRVTGNLTDAVRPILKSIEVLKENGEFRRAARSTATLVNVYMLIGNLVNALDWAKRGVEFVDQSKNKRERIAKYSLLAHVYYNLGKNEKAREWIGRAGELQEREIEQLEKAGKLQQVDARKDMLDNGHYEVLRCTLLADHSEWDKVQQIMESLFKWLPDSNKRSYGLALSMYGLTLCNLSLPPFNRVTWKEAREKLDKSVETIRETGRQDELPRVLLTRARCLILHGGFGIALKDLDEAHEISERLGMHLHKADACLGYARVYLLSEPKELAIAERHLKRAIEIINKSSYLCRIQEVRELQDNLKKARSSSLPKPETNGVGAKNRNQLPTSLVIESNKSITLSDHIDVVLLTALPMELDAVLRYINNRSKFSSSEGLPRTYYQSKTKTGLQIVATCALGMGQLNAALAAKDIVNELHPKKIILVGIAGGLGTEVGLGDIVISEQVVDYELAKVTPKGVEHRWSAYPTDPVLYDRLMNFSSTEWLSRITEQRPNGRGDINPRIMPGLMLSGNKVIADEKTAEALSSVWKQAAAIEMEGAGVATALHQTSEAPAFVVIKAICDKADSRKDNRWQPYAADVAAAFTVSFVQMEIQPSDLEQRVPKDELDVGVPGIDPRALRIVLAEAFNIREVRVLCFDLGVDWEEISGNTKTEKIIELILYMKRRKSIPTLLDYVKKERPGLLTGYVKRDT